MTAAVAAADLKTEWAAEQYKPLFDRYVQLRLHGETSVRAFCQSFPDDWYEPQKVWLYSQAVDFNPYTVTELREAIATADPKTLWNPRIAIQALVALSRDPDEKGTTRLGAMKELNVLCEITIVDENGKTKAGRSLADFYREEGVAPATNTKEAQA